MKDPRDTILELIKSKKVRTVLLTEGQFIGKYVCSNCKSDWVDVDKVEVDDDGEKTSTSCCCSKCGIPDMGEYKIFVNAEKEDEE